MRDNGRQIQLSDHFTLGRLLRFSLPSIIMMLFTSVYSIIDGFFVSNFVGPTGFAAVNLIMPALSILGTFGYMFGAGGSAIIAKTLGEGQHERASELFSLFVWLSVAFSALMMVLGLIFMRPLARSLGATGKLLEDCILYGRIFILGLPAWILLYEFQLFFVTAEKPKIGLFVTVAAGVANVILDAVFVAVLRWGIAGAAAASMLSQLVGGLFPLIYFARPNTSLLKLTKTYFDGKAIVHCCTNGSSELVSGISMSFVGIVFNHQLLRYSGETGVAAYGVLMYVSMIFSAVFLGYCSGVAPIFSFHYGAGNQAELKNLLQKSLGVITIFSVCMVVLAEALARPISALFVGYDETLLQMTVHGFAIYAISYLFMGTAIFGSSLFTALNNGLISALISSLRTLVFELGSVMLFPLIWGIDGIWFSVVIAECMAAVLSILFMVTFRKKYGY